MYDNFTTDALKHLVQYSKDKSLAWTPNQGDLSRFHHLSCFSGGMFALGDHTDFKRSPKDSELFTLGAKITETCYKSYQSSTSGLGSDDISVDSETNKLTTSGGSEEYALRPETIESIFYLWRLTKDDKYREWGWKIVKVWHRLLLRPLKSNAEMKQVTTRSIINLRLKCLFSLQKR
jgi:Glycosyl hydrolase family 47